MTKMSDSTLQEDPDFNPHDVLRSLIRICRQPGKSQTVCPDPQVHPFVSQKLQKTAPTDNPVKSTTHDTEKETATSVVEEQQQRPRTRRPSERQTKSGKWVESLRCSDVGRLWTELHRVVSHHPLVRASRSAGLLIEEGAATAYTDLTQELFVQLLSKNRFEHYLETEMTDYEIECEISQIELTNF